MFYKLLVCFNNRLATIHFKVSKMIPKQDIVSKNETKMKKNMITEHRSTCGIVVFSADLIF